MNAAGFPSPIPRRRRHVRQRGFALIMVVTMLAFIVVLLLGLAVYTRVETAVASNTQRQAQARENARLALNVAIAQLQLHAGPDTRVTATAQNFGGIDGTRHYTGVWSSNAADTETPGTPRTWLVSGNELTQPNPDPEAAPGSTVPAPLAITPAAPGNRTVDLVGRASTGGATRNADYVIAPLTDITATGVPGTPAATPTTIGRYAWWVGDQGVKAPVALPDQTDAILFAPYNSADRRARIRQQMSHGAGAVDTAGAVAFEPADSANAPLVANQKITSASQLAFLRNAANTQLGLARLQQNFHTWSPNNFAVLANTRSGGLRQDLSLAPGLLGAPFAAWANYAAYMEHLVPDPPVVDGEGNVVPPATPTGPTILPAYGEDPIRRRYVMTPHLVEPDNGASHQVGPVLTYFLITFNVRTLPTPSGNPSSGIQPLEVRAKWMLSLWNPYTSALVPEDLRVEVTGLPSAVTIVNEEPTRAGPVTEFSLQDALGSPLRLALPWQVPADASSGPLEDRHSWLPGRVYTWRSIEDTSHGAIPAAGYPAKFYTRSFTASGETNQGVQRPIAGGVTLDGDDPCHLEVSGSEQLTVSVFIQREGEYVRLSRFLSPAFAAGFSTATHAINAGSYQFSYLFRLAESIDTPAAPAAWLATDGRDFRRRTVPPEVFVVGENGNSPEQYENYATIAKPDRLLDRASDAYSYNEDVPLFELPRSPLLSLGELQHLRLVGRRPFMIGNPWGANETLNDIRLGALFDRFYFSGLVDGVVPEANAAGDLILPNPLLKPLRKADHAKVTIEDVRALMSPPITTDPDGNEIPGPPASSYSSKFFLQGGAFNLNSVNATAWAAVLRGIRFPAPASFNYLNASDATGTAEDGAQASIQSGDAQFFRFSQSAQETYKAEAGLADPDPAAPSPANTHLFRRGVRTLGAADLTALAGKIVELIGMKHAAADPLGGPFRSLEEFLSPSLLFAGVDTEGNPLAPRSLLEAAIADAGTNSAIAEFSSQWLTQADVMTALAPLLFPRSDTFVIRTYGEAVNPATSAVEGRAWAEAIVQRVPEYVADPVNNPPETSASAFDAPSDPDDVTSSPTPAHQLNRLYGRRFKIVSFRWLTRADI